MTFMITSTLDITTLPVVSSSVILEEAGYFENSNISLSLRGQVLYYFR
jgi:hypothetical protein